MFRKPCGMLEHLVLNPSVVFVAVLGLSLSALRSVAPARRCGGLDLKFQVMGGMHAARADCDPGLPASSAIRRADSGPLVLRGRRALGGRAEQCRCRASYAGWPSGGRPTGFRRHASRQQRFLEMLLNPVSAALREESLRTSRA